MIMENNTATISVSSSGVLVFKGKEYRCAIGKGGVNTDKKEGDGATPAGCFPLREVFYRQDRIPDLHAPLPMSPLSPDDGWCNDPRDPSYNRKVKLPYVASAESLWRDDHLYDVIVAVGYNDDPPVPGKGSAIFMHVARENYSPTAGCIALAEQDLREILGSLSPGAEICIAA